MKCFGDLVRIACPAQHQTQKNARLLRTQIVSGNDRHLAKIPARRDSPARSSTTLDGDHTAGLHTLQRFYLQWGAESWSETSHDNSGCASRGRRFNQSAVGARIRVNDVHSWQG